MPFVREQIFANAVALYPHLVNEVADKQSSSGRWLDPREVFQVLLTYEKQEWNAVLVHGVPRIKGTLMIAKADYDDHGAHDELLRATGEA